jgi:fido (protein-threonine AMPylation protein)
MNITKAKLVKHEFNGKVEEVNLTIDGVVYAVPFDEGNRHYQAYLEWVAEGNTAEAAD